MFLEICLISTMNVVWLKSHPGTFPILLEVTQQYFLHLASQHQLTHSFNDMKTIIFNPWIVLFLLNIVLLCWSLPVCNSNHGILDTFFQPDINLLMNSSRPYYIVMDTQINTYICVHIHICTLRIHILCLKIKICKRGSYAVTLVSLLATCFSSFQIYYLIAIICLQYSPPL